MGRHLYTIILSLLMLCGFTGNVTGRGTDITEAGQTAGTAKTGQTVNSVEAGQAAGTAEAGRTAGIAKTGRTMNIAEAGQTAEAVDALETVGEGQVADAVDAVERDAADTVEQDAESGEGEGIVFSLLTCTPGTDAYAHFGHTALLMEDSVRDVNAVFNYGCFDATQKHFLFNFVAGNTNYMLEAESLDFFLWRYGVTGNGVTKQRLALTDAECRQLIVLLRENLKKENQTYLYNWLYDNCTQRARDIIEAAICGEVVYREPSEAVTVREMLHAKLENAPWLQFGIDIILGEEIDREVDGRAMMFMPDFYQAELEDARVQENDSTSRSLVAATTVLLEPTEVSMEKASPLNPMVVFGIIVVLTLCISAYDMRRRRCLLWVDVLMLSLQGITGCVVAYLFFFSKHPAVGSNWMVVVLNPLFLIYGIVLGVGRNLTRGNWIRGAECVNLTVLAAFIIIMMCVRQWFNPAVYLMVSALLIRSCVRLMTAGRGCETCSPEKTNEKN